MILKTLHNFSSVKAVTKIVQHFKKESERQLKSSNNTLILNDEYASISEKGGSLPRNILINDWSNK